MVMTWSRVGSLTCLSRIAARWARLRAFSASLLALAAFVSAFASATVAFSASLLAWAAFVAAFVTVVAFVTVAISVSLSGFGTVGCRGGKEGNRQTDVIVRLIPTRSKSVLTLTSLAISYIIVNSWSVNIK